MPQKKRNKALWIQNSILAVVIAFFGYILAAGMHPGANVFEWIQYEQGMLDGMPGSFFAENYFNRYTIPTITALEAAYSFYALIHYMENKDLMTGKTFGSTVWADPASISTKIMDKGRDSKWKKRPEDCFYYVDACGNYHEGRYHKWKILFGKLKERK